MPQPALETFALTRDFGDIRALEDVTLTVQGGQVFGYLGPNGSGKTTSVRILTTLILPTSGTARVLGFDIVSEGKEIRKRVGLVQQRLSYEPYLSVEENLRLYGYIQGLSKVEARKSSRQLLETFELWEARGRKAASLSLGQTRRMQIARELMITPALLFLDEPTIGLDVEARLKTLDIFKLMARDGVTIFFTTHNLSEVDELCDTVAFLNHGKLMGVESVATFRERAHGRALEKAYMEAISGATSGQQPP